MIYREYWSTSFESSLRTKATEGREEMCPSCCQFSEIYLVSYISECMPKKKRPLFTGDRFSAVAVNTGLTVYIKLDTRFEKTITKIRFLLGNRAELAKIVIKK